MWMSEVRIDRPGASRGFGFKGLIVYGWSDFLMARKKQPGHIQDGCRTDFGPLKLWVQTTGLPDRFIVYAEDRRKHKRVANEEGTGTIREAQRCAILMAEQYLKSIGENPEEFETDWKCS